MNIVNNIDCEMYITDDDLEFNGYVYIYIAQLNKSCNTVINSSKLKSSESDEISFKFDEDGFYTICRVKIHNGEIDGNGYYYNDNKFYHKISNDITECTLQDIIDVNDSTEPTVELHYEGFFSTCRLRKCFVTLCKKILENGGLLNKRCESAKVDSDLIYQRDLVWSVYNTINYLVDFGQYMEAQRLVERVNTCPGICHGIEDKNGGGCGCHGTL